VATVEESDRVHQSLYPTVPPLTGRDRTLVGLELLTGAAGTVGGVLLVVRPDGSLLHAKLSALVGSPFSSWRIPGLLLSTLVGGGLLLAGVWQRRQAWHARELSMFAGAGLMAFECAEFAWIGFQPLEALFGIVGMAIFALSRKMPRSVKTKAEHTTAPPVMPAQPGSPGLDLYWIPLGAGARTVRISGMLYEALAAFVQHRPRRAIYHSALVATTTAGGTVIEMAPVRDARGRQERGVVAEGAVGSRLIRPFRLFRYEIRRWPNGVIPDLPYAIASPVRIADEPDVVQQVLDLVPFVPTPVWGRDELHAGEMWNSNSVIAWVLASAAVDTKVGRPPGNGRAPGWDAGLLAARCGPALQPTQSAVCALPTGQRSETAEQDRRRPPRLPCIPDCADDGHPVRPADVEVVADESPEKEELASR